MLVLSFLGVWLLIIYISQSKLQELTEHGVRISAKITSKRCDNHGELLYTFIIDDKKIGGSGTCITPCESAKIGDIIEIVYSPTSPRNSQCTSPAVKLESVQADYFLLFVLFIAMLIVIFRVTSTDTEQRL